MPLNGYRLPGFYTYGYIDGQSVIVFVPCLQDGVPALTIVIKPS